MRRSPEFAGSGKTLAGRAQMLWAGHVAQTADVLMHEQLQYHGLMLGKGRHDCQRENFRAS